MPTAEMRRLTDEVRFAVACLIDPIARARYDDRLMQGDDLPDEHSHEYVADDAIAFEPPAVLHRKRRRSSDIVTGIVVNVAIFAIFMAIYRGRLAVDEQPPAKQPIPVKQPTVERSAVRPRVARHVARQPAPVAPVEPVDMPEARPIELAEMPPQPVVMEENDGPSNPIEVEPKPAPFPAPSEEQRAQDLKALKSIYADDIKAARKLPVLGEKQALSKIAESLLERAKESKEPNTQFAMLGYARMLAADGGDFQLAIDAAIALWDRFDVDPLAEQWEVFRVEFATHATPENVSLLHRFAADCLANGNYDLAQKSLALLRKHTKKELTQFESLVVNRLPQFNKAREVLKSDPKNPAAAADAGEFYFFVLCRVRDGLSLLAIGDDKELAELGKLDLAPEQDQAQVLDLAAKWAKYADKWKGKGPQGKGPTDIAKRLSSNDRAAFYYSQLASDKSSLAGLTAQKFLESWKIERADLQQQMGVPKAAPASLAQQLKDAPQAKGPAAPNAAQQAKGPKTAQKPNDTLASDSMAKARQPKKRVYYPDEGPIWYVPTPMMPEYWVLPPVYSRR